MAMQNFVKLKKEHLEKIGEVMIMVIEWKAHALSAKSFETFENNWLPRFLDQIKTNEWTCNRSHSNTALWIVDQIKHSKKLSPGVSIKNAIHLDQTRLGIEAIEICRAAAKGQIYYNEWCRNSEYNNLFQ